VVDRCRRCQIQRAMGPVRVVVIDEDVEHVLEVMAVEDQEPVEAFSAGGADEALGDRVRLRRAHRGADDLDALACKDGVEVARELAVAVADQVVKASQPVLNCPGELAGLLGDPLSSGVGGAAGDGGPSLVKTRFPGPLRWPV
jgi:hypothetical protein